MKANKPQNKLVLGVAPSTRGFGYALAQGARLLDWGVKTVQGDKNKQSLRKLEKLIVHYQPGVLAVEDHSAKGSQRSARIRTLGTKVIAVATKHKVRVAIFSRQQVRKAFFADGKGTKDALAEILAKRFPEELGSRLPKQRRPWMSEAYQMGIFDAVALCLVHHRGDTVTGPVHEW